MEYLFVHDTKGGWWLKLRNAEEVVDYIEKTSDKYEGAISLYMRGVKPNKISTEERIRLSIEGGSDWAYLQGAYMLAEKSELTLLDGFKALNLTFAEKLLSNIREYGACYINPVGGSTFSIEYDNFIRNTELVFPNFTKEDIRVKQYEGGTHWYAYLGEIQVRDKNVLKWNTYDEAYKKACDLLK